MASGICATLIDREYGIYLEEYFNELLRIERKRSERSKNHFLMFLLDLSRFEEREDKKDIIKKLTNAVKPSIREIDVLGWYRYDTVIGIIFREMKEGAGCSSPVRDMLLKRIYTHLQKALDLEEIRNILVSCHSFPEKTEILLSNTPFDLDLYPDLMLTTKSPLKTFSFFIKTLMDVFGSLIGIIILSPLMIAIAILVKLSSPGPILFKQERVGLFGKTFTFLKFRTMYVHERDDIHKEFISKFITGQLEEGKEKEEKEKVFKIKDDPRVTPIGRILRKLSLDELPQLFNVLKGDMSLVGPRPPIPYEYEQYDIWHKGRILEFKPGITGLWQVEGRSATTFNEMVRLDLRYIREWSLWLDIKILFKTVFVVIKGKGAY
ncbi:MAG: exopolysaccharide biosynthesis polyprenyl glycosylphosphotransferase [Syntrophorhabdaceae bacterium]|nr:exopolysaccharide biosynthesis polyprenyl glycosylphosphotransferase [Syntrophorhabdaceae bacterium]